MKRYRFKPRFFVIAGIATVIAFTSSITHIDRVCGANVEAPVATSEVVEVVEAPELINLGEFKLTAYCSCEKCCGEYALNRPDGVVYGSIGEELRAGYSIAVDPDVIPYNSMVLIGDTWYEAQDTGGAIQENRIDVYFDSHEEALQFGVQSANVFMLSEV